MLYYPLCYGIECALLELIVTVCLGRFLKQGLFISPLQMTGLKRKGGSDEKTQMKLWEGLVALMASLSR